MCNTKKLIDIKKTSVLTYAHTRRIHMILKEWLIRKGMTQRKLASKLGVSSNFLCMIINGKTRMSAAVALKIHEITKGQVSLEEAMFPEKQKSIIPLKGKK